MKYEDRFDSLIQYLTEQHFPVLDWLIIKAQVAQESAFDPNALSPASCMGLMQISSPLACERLAEPKKVWCVQENLKLGIQYLKEQYDHFPEIPTHHGKILFALASYNCGRGYVNVALRLARKDEGQSVEEPGLWQTWEYTKQFLKDYRCMWRGKWPDHGQVIQYVENIMHHYSRLLKLGV